MKDTVITTAVGLIVSLIVTSIVTSVSQYFDPIKQLFLVHATVALTWTLLILVIGGFIGASVYRVWMRWKSSNRVADEIAQNDNAHDLFAESSEDIMSLFARLNSFELQYLKLLLNSPVPQQLCWQGGEDTVLLKMGILRENRASGYDRSSGKWYELEPEWRALLVKNHATLEGEIARRKEGRQSFEVSYD